VIILNALGYLISIDSSFFLHLFVKSLLIIGGNNANVNEAVKAMKEARKLIAELPFECSVENITIKKLKNIELEKPFKKAAYSFFVLVKNM